MKNDIFMVSDNIRKKITRECEDQNCLVQLITRKSDHPSDDFLYIVVAKKVIPLWDDKPYVVWLYNDSRESLYDGAYDLSSTRAMQVATERLYVTD